MNKNITIYDEDEIIRFFEDAGYNNVEVIGERLLYTSGEDVINFSVNEAINFINYEWGKLYDEYY